MRELRYTLVAEGPSDRALLPILTWLIQQYTAAAITPALADLRQLPRPPRSLSERIAVSLDLFPCDLLFVHRDADRDPRQYRVQEIHAALEALGDTIPVPVVPVVPVRMTEAWLLFDVVAIRRAAGNPNGRVPLELPAIHACEGLVNPKDELIKVVRTASGLSVRRQKKLQVEGVAVRVADLIDDFSPLSVLSAFRALQDDVRLLMEE